MKHATGMMCPCVFSGARPFILPDRPHFEGNITHVASTTFGAIVRQDMTTVCLMRMRNIIMFK